MGKIFIGLNTEFSRSSDKPFEWAVEEAAKMGFEYLDDLFQISLGPLPPFVCYLCYWRLIRHMSTCCAECDEDHEHEFERLLSHLRVRTADSISYRFESGT